MVKSKQPMKKTSSSKRTKKVVKETRPEYQSNFRRAKPNRPAAQSGSEAMNASAQATRRTISGLLENLPPESLQAVEQFVRFLRSNPMAMPLAEPSYPTVPNPASSLTNWLNALPEGYDGDALTDTEALYGEE